MNINQNERMQLLSTSDCKLANRLNKPITVNNITHGASGAKIAVERATRGHVVVVSYKNNVHELFKHAK